MKKHLTIITTICASILLAGCGGGGGGGSTATVANPAPELTIESFTIAGSTEEDATVTVNGTADTDLSSTAYAVTLAASSFTPTAGVYAVNVSATDTAGNESTQGVSIIVVP